VSDGESFDNVADDVAVDSVGRPVVVGAFVGSPDLDPSPGVLMSTSNGGADGYVLRYTADGALVGAGSASVDDATDRVLALAPNPSRGLVVAYVPLARGGEAVVTVTDMLGRVVRSEVRRLEAGKNAVTIDLSGAAPGTYVVRLATPESRHSERIIHQPE
jgi:hypothetical protein